MALEVETGAGSAIAESYASVADADAYFARLGVAAWALLTEPQKEAGLRRGAQYLETTFEFGGTRSSAVQALAFPRTGMRLHGFQVAPDSIPSRLVDANCELAMRAATGELFTDRDAQEVKSVTVGPISQTFKDSTTQGQVRFTIVDRLVKPLLSGFGAFSLQIERAS
jgi:hypothetical protein